MGTLFQGQAIASHTQIEPARWPLAAEKAGGAKFPATGAPTTGTGTPAAQAAMPAAPQGNEQVAAKQIPDMTDAELGQMQAHYGPDHKRTPKIVKEINRRALVAKLKPGTVTIDDAAHKAATSMWNALPQPTDGQKAAGNYAKGHVTRWAGWTCRSRTQRGPCAAARTGRQGVEQHPEAPLWLHQGDDRQRQGPRRSVRQAWNPVGLFRQGLCH